MRWVKDAFENATNSTTRRNISEAVQNKRKLKQIDRTNDTVIDLWDRAYIAGKTLNINTGSILRVCRGKQKTAYGYKWRFCE